MSAGEILPTTSKPAGGGGFRSHLGSLLFLLPGAVWLLLIVVYPLIATVVRSLFDGSGQNFVGLGHYKAIVFMPLVFSATAAGLTWASIFFIDPHTGMVNATIQGAANAITPPGLYPIDPTAGQTVSGLVASKVQPGAGRQLESKTTVGAGSTIELGLIGISPTTLEQNGAVAAVVPSAASGAITGLVWRDFSPTHPS